MILHLSVLFWSHVIVFFRKKKIAFHMLRYSVKRKNTSFVNLHRRLFLKSAQRMAKTMNAWPGLHADAVISFYTAAPVIQTRHVSNRNDVLWTNKENARNRENNFNQLVYHKVLGRKCKYKINIVYSIKQLPQDIVILYYSSNRAGFSPGRR